MLSKYFFCVLLLFIIIFQAFPSLQINAWSNGGYSSDPSNPDYGTHDWLAQHSLDWLPSNEKEYIENNLATYLYGTELPDNGQASDGIGDTTKHHIYFFSDGTLQDDISAVRASEEYSIALDYLNVNDYENAAKHAGIMTHYIADVAVFGHVMGSGTDWGAEQHHSDYENYVNSRTNSYDDDFNIYLSYDGALEIITAFDAAVDLAYDTTFDVDGDLTCVWMDQNYDWNNPMFKNRCGESLNLAVNYLTDVLHTLYISQNNDNNANHVVINEIEFNPPGNDNYLSVEEWVELYNPTENSIDIGGWTFSTTHGITVSITIPQGVSIEAHGYYVCKQGSQWLDNDDESVVLRDSIDREIDSTPERSDDQNNNFSWQRYPNGLDADSSSDWHFRFSTYGASNGGEKDKIGDLKTTWKNAVIVVGTSEPYGPLPWGALIDDTIGANNLATALSYYGSPSSDSDNEVADWIENSFSWKPDSPTSLIAVGGTAVNLVSYEYNFHSHFDLSVTGEYIELNIAYDGIDYIRLYFEPKQYLVRYSDTTEMLYTFEDNDFASAYAFFDSTNSKHVFLIMGMCAEGTVGACRYLAMNLDTFPSDVANAESIILHWYDSNSDGVALGEEMTVIATYP